MATKKVKFPYQAFVLTDSMKVKEVTLVAVGAWGGGSSYHQVQSGKDYHISELHSTAALAVEAGKVTLASQEIRLNKQLENLNKRKANLASAGEKLTKGEAK